MNLTTPSSKSKLFLLRAVKASKAVEVVIHSFFGSALFGADGVVTALLPGKDPPSTLSPGCWMGRQSRGIVPNALGVHKSRSSVHDVN